MLETEMKKLLYICAKRGSLKLLLDAGANPNDVDASGRSPLFAAAINKNCPKKTVCFYSDVTGDPQMFWRTGLEKKLDFWAADKQGVTLLSVLIASENFALTRAFIEVSCKENNATDEVKLSLLNAICKESEHTHWKTILVDIILNSTRASDPSLHSPLRFCCKNIVKFGLLGDKPHSIRGSTNDGPNNDHGQPPPKEKKEK